MTNKMLCSLALLSGILTACVTQLETDDSMQAQDDQASARKSTACPLVELCIVGYAWSDHSCSCEPVHSQACGPSLTCHGTDHCCVPSSAEPNYYCAAATEVCQ